MGKLNLEKLKNAKKWLEYSYRMTGEKAKLVGLKLEFPEYSIFKEGSIEQKELDWVKENCSDYVEL